MGLEILKSRLMLNVIVRSTGAPFRRERKKSSDYLEKKLYHTPHAFYVSVTAILGRDDPFRHSAESLTSLHGLLETLIPLGSICIKVEFPLSSPDLHWSPRLSMLEVVNAHATPLTSRATEYAELLWSWFGNSSTRVRSVTT